MNETHQKEDLWGYGKRLSFVREVITSAYPAKTDREITILDVGCGTGSHLGIPLAELGFRYTGIDTHAPSIGEATRLGTTLSNAEFKCCAIEEMGGTFDVLILSEVLEHVADPAKLLNESLKKLAPCGTVIITVPNGYGEFEWDAWLYKSLGFEKLLAKRNGSNSEAELGSTLNVENGHVQFFTMGRLEKMFENAGLEIVDRRGSSLFSGPFVAHTLARVPGFIQLNAKAADRVPLVLAGGWFFSLRARELGG